MFDEIFVRETIANSFSYAECLRKFGKLPMGYNYYFVKNLIKKYSLDISHFDRSKYGIKTQISQDKIPIEEYLSNRKKIEGHRLKLKLIKENIMEYKCSECLITEWKDKPIPLELDHIDGNRLNNNLDNLRILCPNCHSQTPTYKNKNAKWKKKEWLCECGATRKKRSKLCRLCSLNKNRPKNKPLVNAIWYPSDDELKKLVWEKPITEVSKQFGVSDNAIIKRCKKLGISRPSKGHWIKGITPPCVKPKKIHLCECGNSMKRTSKRCRDCFES